MDKLARTQESEFLFKRLLDPLSGWAVLVPVLLALGVLLLLVAFRRENRWWFLLWGSLVVGGISAIYVPMALLFMPLFSWWVVLIPVLAVALLYVVLMYVKDARTIHPMGAACLGLMRLAVYAILTWVFLQPTRQYYDTTETPSEVLFLFDVSGSMFTVDQLPEVGQDPAKLPTRQDLVARFLTAEGGPGRKGGSAFLKEVLAKTPVKAYRFGTVLDEMEPVRFAAAADAWEEGQWRKWLDPDPKDFRVPADLSAEERLKLQVRQRDLVEALRSGTNVGGAGLQGFKLENTSYLQAVVVVSDGQSNSGSEDQVRQLQALAGSRKPPVPIFTVGVGEYRQPASIRIDDIQAPEVARPDDKFLVRIPVVGTGLTDEEFDLTLEAQRVEDSLGKPVAGEQKFTLGPKKGKFRGAGDFPQDTIEFEIDIQGLKKLKTAEDKAGVLEGTWEFRASVPRHHREVFTKAKHESDQPARVLVQKKKLRVLLFSSGAGREYQFVRNILFREAQDNRLDLCIFLQSGGESNVDQDVEQEKLLRKFPDRKGAGTAAEKYSSIDEFDVVIAIDPDWTALTPSQFNLLKEWVGTNAGGMIFIAGGVHTYQLARPGGLDLSALTTIYPVVLKDSRLHGIGIGHDASRPYLLDFTPGAKNFDFLRLDEKEEGPTAGWDEFFWGSKAKPEPGKDAKPRRGFYNYYPVDRIKPDSQVVATFKGPDSSRINDGRDEMPFIVAMRYGAGKSVYIGAQETWRLRTYKSAFHERFWIKLVRYVAASTTPQKKYGRFYAPARGTVGSIAIEAQIKGEDLNFLPRDSRPNVVVQKLGGLEETKPTTFELRAKNVQGDWNGWFAGSFKPREAGEYELRLPIPGTSEELRRRISIRKPNVELDNLRNDFGALYQMASPAGGTLAKLRGDARAEVEKALQVPAGADLKESKEATRLFLPLDSAHVIAKALNVVPPRRESVKGSPDDLWDDGWNSGLTVHSFWLAVVGSIVLGLIGFLLLLVLRQWVFGSVFLGVCVILSAGVGVLGLVTGIDEWPWLEVALSWVLLAVVALLAIEWMSRKLLKLA